MNQVAKQETRDVFYVAPHHDKAHAILENWARWVKVSRPSWVNPMWRNSQSNARHWHVPEIRITCDMIQAHATERQVGKLPAPMRYVLRWAYVYCWGESKARRDLGLTKEGLVTLLDNARESFCRNLLANSETSR